MQTKQELSPQLPSVEQRLKYVVYLTTLMIIFGEYLRQNSDASVQELIQNNVGITIGWFYLFLVLGGNPEISFGEKVKSVFTDSFLSFINASALLIGLDAISHSTMEKAIAGILISIPAIILLASDIIAIEKTTPAKTIAKLSSKDEDN